MTTYRGWKSTKLHLALITMGVLTGVYALAGFPVEQFGNFALAVIAACGVYSSAATAEKFTKALPFHAPKTADITYESKRDLTYDP